MAKPYASEMSRLAETFGWAVTTDLQPLRRAVGLAGLSALRAIGSGGSLTAAHALTGFHQHLTGRLAAVATPLEAIDEPVDRGSPLGCSARGAGILTFSPQPKR